MTFKYPSRIYRDYDDLLFFMGTPQSPRLTAEVRHNLIGRFLRFAEHLNDLRCYSICLPQGHRSTCWSLFEKTLLDTIPQQRPLGPLPLAQPKPPTKNPPPPQNFSKPDPQRPCKPEPLPKPNQPTQKKIDNTQPFTWELAVICDCSEQRPDFLRTAIAIEKVL